MNKILISACLIGQKVRYDGGDAFCNHSTIQQWHKEKRLIPICPEVSAGLSVPRISCEIVGDGGGGHAVLTGKAEVVSRDGSFKTIEFVNGAQLALKLAKKHNIVIATLKSNSPSCGNHSIYDGTFSGSKISGMGVTAALLSENGIKVFNEQQILEAADYLSNLL